MAKMKIGGVTVTILIYLLTVGPDGAIAQVNDWVDYISYELARGSEPCVC